MMDSQNNNQHTPYMMQLTKYSIDSTQATRLPQENWHNLEMVNNLYVYSYYITKRILIFRILMLRMNTIKTKKVKWQKVEHPRTPKGFFQRSPMGEGHFDLTLKILVTDEFE